MKGGLKRDVYLHSQPESLNWGFLTPALLFGSLLGSDREVQIATHTYHELPPPPTTIFVPPRHG